jgi:CubicO group peptidase (beta-lactamase class C family)
MPPGSRRTTRDDLVARCRALLGAPGDERFATSRVAGASLALAFDDGTVLSAHWGDSQRASRDSCRYRAWSLTKPLTAFVVLRLVDAGVLTLDRSIRSYLGELPFPVDGVPDRWIDGVTTRRVLSHGAGLSIRAFAPIGAGEAEPACRSLIVGSARQPGVRIEHAPGRRVRYSGGGYALLQLLVERVTGEAYADTARRLVLDALGMTESGFPSGTDGRVVRPYQAREKPAADTRCPVAAVGGLVTTARDLARLWCGVMGSAATPPGCHLIRPDLATSMHSRRMARTWGATFGLGFHAKRRGCVVVFGHGGWSPGWWGRGIGLLPHRVAIVGMSNSTNGAEFVKPMTSELVRVVAGLRLDRRR